MNKIQNRVYVLKFYTVNFSINNILLHNKNTFQLNTIKYNNNHYLLQDTSQILFSIFVKIKRYLLNYFD